MIPAKVIPSKQVAYVPYGGSEVAKYDFHVSSMNKAKEQRFFLNKICQETSK